jgi:hypothetical protein
MSEVTPLTVNTFEDAKEIYRQKSLRQALYDAGEIVMSGVLVNLHGDEHRARRRLENRLFRRETLVSYERDFETLRCSGFCRTCTYVASTHDEPRSTQRRCRPPHGNA